MPRDTSDRRAALRLAEVERRFADVAGFCRESLTVRDKRGWEVPLEPGPAQLRLFDKIRAARAAAKPGRFIYLKARQVWVSTAFEAYLFHELAFHSGQRAKVVAHDEQAAANITGYFRQFLAGYKPFGGLLGLSGVVKNNDGVIAFANNSDVSINTARTLTTGRSFSLRYLHLSEFPFWQHAKVLMDALMQSVPDDPDTCVLIEGSANGKGGEFYRLWREASDPKSGSVWTAIFFGWWEHPEYRRALDVPRDEFIQSLDAEERGLIERYACTLEQLAWRRWCIKANCGGSVESFHQEYPSNPEEAFLSSGRPRFSLVHLGRMPVIDAPFAGQLEWHTTPVGQRIVRVPSENGPLKVWKQPQQGHRYVIGVDLAEGIDRSAVAGRAVLGGENPDFSVASVLDIDSGEQVAVLRGRIDPGTFADMVDLLGRWYNLAYLIPEANGPGLAFLAVLQRVHYPMGRVYHREPTPDERYSTENDTLLDKLGWKTTTVTRPQLVSALDGAIRELAIFLHDAVTVDECYSFIYKPNGKTEAQEGDHDDCVIATALAVIGIRSAPPDRRLSQVARDEHSRGRPARALGRYGTGGDQPRGTTVKL
jgi:hypothetical protein